MTRGVPGPDVPLCGRLRRQDDDGEPVAPGEGQPCERPAGEGVPGLLGVAGTPCRLHGGRTLPAIRAGTVRRVEAECRALLAEENVQPVIDPVSELESLGGEVLAWKALLRQRLGELDPQDWRRMGMVGQEEMHALVGLYERSLDKAAKLLVDMAKLDLGERRVRLEERQTDLAQNIIEMTLRRHGLDASSTEVRATLYEVAGELGAT